jgi:hypothetical protein
VPSRMRGLKTFRARVFWSFIPIILVLFGLVTAVTVRQQTTLIEEEFLKRGREMAMSLANASAASWESLRKRSGSSSPRCVAWPRDPTCLTSSFTQKTAGSWPVEELRST